MNYGNFAEWEIKSAWMGSGFARDLCARWFDWNEDDLDDCCGLDTKGRHRGEIYWLTVKKGGWQGGVTSRGMKCVAIVVDGEVIAKAWKDNRFPSNLDDYLRRIQHDTREYSLQDLFFCDEVSN